MNDDAPEANTEQTSAARSNESDNVVDGISNDYSAHDMSSSAKANGNGADQPAQKEEQTEDEDAAALARMMAFQEEQQSGDIDATNPATQNGNAAAANIEDVNLDPNVALLGDAPADEDDEDEAPHPNLNNPAAIALRQRQAAQNAARLNPNNNAWMANQPYPIRKLLSFLQPSLRYTPLSLLAAGLLLHHTLRTRQQFYLAIVFLQSSKLAYILLGNAIIALAVSSFTLLTKLFLDGGLRPNERDTIGENIRWDVTETCFALTIFRSELDVMTAIEFLGLVIMKCLHWSVELRGGHLRMTEEVFVYPGEDDDDIVNGATENPAAAAALAASQKPWYHRIPHLRLTHIRYYTLVQILLLLDILAVAHCALSVATHGPSVDILFGFEAAILLVSGLSSLSSYHLHVVDGFMGVFHHLAEGEHHHVPVGGMADEPVEGEEQPRDANGDDPRQENQPQQEGGGEEANADANRPPATRTKTLAKILVERLANPWRDRRATLSFAIELQAQAAKFLFYVVFFAIVFTYYGMPINIFREVYVSFQQLRRRLIAFNTYRRLTHNMDKRFESIQDEEELDRLGHTCIICRDQMDLLGGCKKLPGCGHAFHTHCLREWLVQQQTCPTCRADIAANEARRKKRLERERVAAEREAAAAGEGTGENAPAQTGDANNGAAASAAAAGGAAADNAALGQAEGSKLREQAREQLMSEASRPEKQAAESSSPTTLEDVALPVGWTRHVDDGSGRAYYYNKELGKSSWDKPESSKDMSNVAETTNNASATDVLMNTTSTIPFYQQQQSTPPSGQFPCLYRITFPSGAPVFSPNHSPHNNYGINMMMACPEPPQRFIPKGKLIVCTSMEYWPMPFQEAMICMPDGYVRSRDVERFLMLTPSAARENGDGVRRRSLEVGAL